MMPTHEDRQHHVTGDMVEYTDGTLRQGYIAQLHAILPTLPIRYHKAALATAQGSPRALYEAIGADLDGLASTEIRAEAWAAWHAVDSALGGYTIRALERRLIHYPRWLARGERDAIFADTVADVLGDLFEAFVVEGKFKARRNLNPQAVIGTSVTNEYLKRVDPSRTYTRTRTQTEQQWDWIDQTAAPQASAYKGPDPVASTILEASAEAELREYLANVFTSPKKLDYVYEHMVGGYSIEELAELAGVQRHSIDQMISVGRYELFQEREACLARKLLDWRPAIDLEAATQTGPARIDLTSDHTDLFVSSIERTLSIVRDDPTTVIDFEAETVFVPMTPVVRNRPGMVYLSAGTIDNEFGHLWFHLTHHGINPAEYFALRYPLGDATRYAATTGVRAFDSIIDRIHQYRFEPPVMKPEPPANERMDFSFLNHLNLSVLLLVPRKQSKLGPFVEFFDPIAVRPILPPRDAYPSVSICTTWSFSNLSVRDPASHPHRGGRFMMDILERPEFVNSPHEYDHLPDWLANILKFPV